MSSTYVDAYVIAAGEGREDDVLKYLQKLTRWKVEMNKLEGTRLAHLLLLSSKLGQRRVVERLLELGVNGESITTTRRRPLHFAAGKGYGPIVRILIAADVNLNAEDESGKTPLHYACEGGHINVVAALVESFAHVNSKNHRWRTPLHFAAARGFISVIDILVNAGAYVEAQDRDGSTALHVACQSRCEETVLRLLHHGSSVNAVDTIGDTPLHVACSESLPGLIEILCSHGANVNAKSDDGQTPLHYSVLQEDGVGIVPLLESGAEVNAKNKSHETPLHYARTKLAAERLLEAGAHPHVKDCRGRTPIDGVCKDPVEDDDPLWDLLDVFLDYGAYDDSAQKSDYKRIFEMLSSHLYQEYSFLYRASEVVLEYFTKIITARLNVYANCKIEVTFPEDSLMYDTHKYFENQCTLEIEMMKNKMVNDDSDVSYYDILRGRSYVLENLPLCPIDSRDLQTEFPIYGRLVALSWKKIALLDGTHRFFKLTPEMSVLLPELIDEICSFLDQKDLENMTKISDGMP